MLTLGEEIVTWIVYNSSDTLSQAGKNLYVHYWANKFYPIEDEE